MPPAGDNRQHAPAAKAAASRAISRPLAVLVFLAVAVAGSAADLLSKDRVFRSMLDTPAVRQQAQEKLSLLRARQIQPTGEQMLHELRVQRQVLPGIKFTLSTNPGVVFGIRLPAAVTLLTTGITIVLVAVFFAFSDGRAWPIHVALALITGGAVGNLYDRVFAAVYVPGLSEPIVNQVRDFIDCSQLYYPYIFNIADVLLVLGVAIPLVHWCAGKPLAVLPKKR